MNLDGAKRIGRLGHMHMVERFQRTARHRHFGADDVDGLFTARARDRGLGGRRKVGRTRGDHLVGEYRRIAGASHAGVEMQLGEAGGGIGIDHRDRLPHRLGGRQMLPRVRAEMVAAKDQAVERNARAGRMLLDEAAEGGRRHAGITALMVDLVACRLDQHIGAMYRAMAERCFDHQRMRRTDRSDAAVPACRAPAGYFRKSFCREGHARVPVSAMKASTSASR